MARSIWKGSIAFGLVNIPVSLTSAERRPDIHLHMVDSKTHARIRYERVNADTGAGDKNLFGYGAAAGFNFRKGHYYSGLDVRYLNTEERNRVGFENWVMQAKVGINF